MNRFAILPALMLCLAACAEDTSEGPPSGPTAPTVTRDAVYGVVVEQDIVYAEGLAHDRNSAAPVAINLLLDVYAPDNDAANRPIFVFIHGGGFTGGTKNKPEIEAMGDYFASRGWVFASVDYRTTEEMGNLTEPSRDAIVGFYDGIAPAEWVEHGLDAIEAGLVSPMQFQQAVAMYAAQRDAKAAVRWMVANAATYGANPDFLTVGGASAGAITATTLGITDLEHFRDEISDAADPTRATTQLDVGYAVRSVVAFWGSTNKLNLFQGVYGVDPYDAGDPELFLVHGTADQNPSTPYSESEQFQALYTDLGVHSELVPLEGAGHGAWGAEVDGKGLFELSFDFLVDRQGLAVME